VFGELSDSSEDQLPCITNGTIRDQVVRDVGWAFAAVAMVENQYYRVTCERVNLSVAQVIDRARCDGTPSPYCALQYMHTEGIMYDRDYPYVAGKHTPKLYDVNKLAPVSVGMPERICTEGNVSVRTECLVARLNETFVATTICLAPRDDTAIFGTIGYTTECFPMYHSINLLYPVILSGLVSIRYQNSSGLGWAMRGVGLYRISWGDDINNRDPRGGLANLVTAVVRKKEIISGSGDQSSSISQSSTDDKSNDTDDDSNTNKSSGDRTNSSSIYSNECVQLAPFMVFCSMLLHARLFHM